MKVNNFSIISCSAKEVNAEIFVRTMGLFVTKKKFVQKNQKALTSPAFVHPVFIGLTAPAKDRFLSFLTCLEIMTLILIVLTKFLN